MNGARPAIDRAALATFDRDFEETTMFRVVDLAVAACRVAAWRRASRPLPHLSDRLLRDIGFMRACVADGHRSRTPLIPLVRSACQSGFNARLTVFRRSPADRC
jgi:uncharacterized protein YjiS (DUF1127 family)